MLSENIIEIDQSFVLVEASETDAEIFFQTVEKYLEERIQRQEDEERKKLEREKADENIVVENKVINVNNSSKEDTKSLFCWGTFVSDTGNIEKRTFLS